MIWKFCDGYHTIKAIEEEMNKNFPAIEYGDVLKDIRATLDDFNKNKLLIQ